MIKYIEERGGKCMEVTFFGTSAGLPTKDRNTQAIALNLEPYSNSIWLFDRRGDSTSNFASLDKIRQS